MQPGASLRYKSGTALNIKRKRNHGNLLRSRVICDIRSYQILTNSSFDRSSPRDEVWPLYAMRIAANSPCEVLCKFFEIKFQHDSSGTVWHKCLCLVRTCIYYLDLRPIDKAHAWHKWHGPKPSMEGAGSIRSKTMVVRQMGHMEILECREPAARLPTPESKSGQPTRKGIQLRCQ